MDTSDKNKQRLQNRDQLDEQNEWHDTTETDKYLALEQPGVTWSGERDPMKNADQEFGSDAGSDFETFKPGGENSRNSDAFSQDDYLLNDNIDLDEDQNISISSDDR